MQLNKPRKDITHRGEQNVRVPGIGTGTGKEPAVLELEPEPPVPVPIPEIRNRLLLVLVPVPRIISRLLYALPLSLSLSLSLSLCTGEVVLLSSNCISVLFVIANLSLLGSPNYSLRFVDLIYLSFHQLHFLLVLNKEIYRQRDLQLKDQLYGSLRVPRNKKMGKNGSRDWTQIYAIYGVDDWQTPLFLLIHAIVFSILSVLFLMYFEPICFFLQHFLPGPTSARFAAGFSGSVTALSSICLFFAAANFFYSAVSLHWDMSQRIVSSVPDWSAVRHALDIGCGRGILLNAIAMQLKKSGSSGRVVGLNPALTQSRALSPNHTLRTAGLEGVQEYVTCRPGDPRTLPFSDSYFDVVVSAVFVHTVGKEFGPKSAAAAAERMRVLGEVVRVLKPGGVGVVWDLVHTAEYVQRLNELRMEEIRVSERVLAFMTSSHIVSFRKPRQHLMGPGEVRLDWRFNNLC